MGRYQSTGNGNSNKTERNITICYNGFPLFRKLDGAGPVDNRPSTNKLHHLVPKKMTCDTWNVTHDTWHVTCDTRHVTQDMWHVTWCGGWTFSQNFSSLAFTVCDLWYFELLEEKANWLTDWINKWMTNQAVCRTALTTPGLRVPPYL